MKSTDHPDFTHYAYLDKISLCGIKGDFKSSQLESQVTCKVCQSLLTPMALSKVGENEVDKAEAAAGRVFEPLRSAFPAIFRFQGRLYQEEYNIDRDEHSWIEITEEQSKWWLGHSRDGNMG